MTKPLDPDIKALRAINRAFSELPEDRRQRVMEWVVARALSRSWISLPRVRWSAGSSETGEAE
jgi:hypothetical protein